MKPTNIPNILLAILAASLLSCGHPGQRATLDLSGTWTTPIGECRLPGTTDESHLGEYGLDTAVTSRPGRLYTYSGTLVYERKVKIPRSFSGKSLRLVMERTKPSTLWVDGDSIGSFGHIYAPHVYELPALQPGWHDIAIRVDNSADAVPSEIQSSHAWGESTQTNWNGILGDFLIEAVEPVHIGTVSVWPSAARKEAVVRLDIISDRDVGNAGISLCAEPRTFGKATERPVEAVFETSLKEGVNELSYTLSLGDDALLWSEFHPVVYSLDVSLRAGEMRDSRQASFGLRDFGTEGTQFTINGFKTFLRGKHDACVFPLTGYAPMDTDSWRKVFAKAKEYGINHYRFHSWTPPEAAFEAADMEGIYLQPELPLWGAIERGNTELNEFLLHEAEMLLEEFGSHPSFVMFSLGNELHGDVTLMREWIDSLRASDSRHLYCFGSNNNLGWLGPQDGEDFFVACRVGWGEGYTSHTRTSFAYVDAEKGGILNNTRPSTSGDYSVAISKSGIPVVGHETCQFQIYPDYSQIDKYTGVLYPYNLEIFRDRLGKNGLSHQAAQFARATGEFSAECYKADLEYAFRTPGFGGFQMLDLQDYPGQGTALVGILDAFMDSKGAITPERFRGFCSPVVPLAVFSDYCYTESDTLRFDIMLSNYLERSFKGAISWTLAVTGQDDGSMDGTAPADPDNCHGSIAVSVQQGGVGKCASIAVPWSALGKAAPFKAMLTLSAEEDAAEKGAEDCSDGKSCSWTNSYNLWVYPDYRSAVPDPQTCADGRACHAGNCQSSGHSAIFRPLDGRISGCQGVAIFHALDDELRKHLENGGKALLVPDHKDIQGCSVGGLFTPDYWNWSMFKTISENAGKEVSPGTLSLLSDPCHPALAAFPNDGRSDWQWWSIARNSRPMVLDPLPKDYFPVIQAIDNIERNHKLGILFELKVAGGSLLVCTTDLDAISGTPEGAAFMVSIMNYFASDDFMPSTAVSWDELQALFGNTLSGKDIEGVKNVTDYDTIY